MMIEGEHPNMEIEEILQAARSPNTAETLRKQDLVMLAAYLLHNSSEDDPLWSTVPNLRGHKNFVLSSVRLFGLAVETEFDRFAPLQYSRTALERFGFEGFVPVRELGSGPTSRRVIPTKPGVYVVYTDAPSLLTFSDANPAGAHAGESHTLPHDTLRRRKSSGRTLYIGKSGVPGGKANLRKRIAAYIRHGQGRGASHRGGKHIWQIAGFDDLLVAWKCTFAEDCADVEAAMIHQFADIYRKPPFANDSLPRLSPRLLGLITPTSRRHE